MDQGRSRLSGSAISLIDKLITLLLCQVTEVAKGGRSFLECFSITGHHVSLYLSHMILRFSFISLWRCCVLAIELQRSCARMVGGRETLHIAIVLWLRCSVVLEAVHCALSDCPVMACLKLGHICASTRTLALHEKVRCCWPARVITRHDVPPEIPADAPINLCWQRTVVSVGFSGG